MDPITVFEAGASALTLAEKLADLVEESREEEKAPRLTEIIGSLQVSAVELCRDFGEEMRRIKADLESSGIDIDKSIPKLYADLHWYNFISKSRLKDYQQRFSSIYQSLAVFIDDVTAVLICSQDSQRLSRPFRKAREMKKELDHLVSSDASIREIADRMLKMIEDIYARLEEPSYA